jgi:precorrin-3B C17-methyltransferase
MAYIGRLAGAILFKTVSNSKAEYILIGDLKSPCSFEEFGFKNPGEIRPDLNHFIQLEVTHPDRVNRIPFKILVDLEGEKGAEEIYQRLVIYRNHSVSERLLNLLSEECGNITQNEQTFIDARWLGTVPLGVWRIVRDQVLRCI